MQHSDECCIFIVIMKRLLIFFLLIVAVVPLDARKVTVSGFISDSSSGECLIGAAVYDSLSASGTVSNNYGFYSLTLESGDVSLAYSYIGYESFKSDFLLDRDTVVNVKLTPSSSFLREAVVTASRGESGVRGTQMSAIEVPVRQIRMVPALLGEADVIKALQLLPGVQSGSEGSAGLYVRGGGPDENLLLLDGVPLYGVNHLFGFFSVFNADAVKSVTLYKGSFPARFGSRLSSVVDVRTEDGNDNSYHGSLSIGLIAAKFNLEGPIVKGKTTFSISGRRTYLDVLTRPLLAIAQKIEDSDTRSTGGYYFYDLNAKVTHRFSNSDRLYASFYSGLDNIYVRMSENGTFNYDTSDGAKITKTLESKGKAGWNWGNMVGAMRWNHIFNLQLFVNTSVSYTRYSHILGVDFAQTTKTSVTGVPGGSEITLNEKMKYSSGIDDVAANADFEYRPSPKHDMKFGGGYVHHTFRPGVSAFLSYDGGAGAQTVADTTIGNSNIYSHEFSLYAEDNFEITDYLKLNGGLRYSLYNVNGRTYHSLEPRLGVRLLVTDNFSVKASYSRMSQYVHLLSNTSLSMPSDLWVPVTADIEPMVSNQAALGLFYALGPVDLSLEGYYKGMSNVIEYRDGASFLGSASDWESKVCTGIGWAYGVEFMAQKKVGNTTGWVAYTWSKSQRLFNRENNIINFGRPFYSKYDRRHDLSVTLTHSFSKRFDLSGSFVYSTGNCGTLALQTYPQGHVSEEDPYSPGNIEIGGYISGRNNYRMPSYNRMDVGCNFYRYFRSHPDWKSIWNISVYNVYNRKNPFIVYPGYDTVKASDGTTETNSTKKVLRQVSLFPIIPSVSYTFQF